MNTAHDGSEIFPATADGGVESTSDGPRSGTQAIERAMAILRAFETEAADGLAAAEVARRVKLTVPTTRRIMGALERTGALDRSESSDTFQLGLGMAILGGITMQRMGFAAALPELEQLSTLTGEAVNLGLLDGAETVTVVHLPSRHSLRLESHPGARNMAHVCAMGKALLAVNGHDGFDMHHLERFTPKTICDPAALRAELTTIRERGYSISNEERAPGVCAIGVPIVLDDGHAIAAIAVQAPTVRMTDKRVAELAELALSAAHQLASGPFGQAHLTTGYWLKNIS